MSSPLTNILEKIKNLDDKVERIISGLEEAKNYQSKSPDWWKWNDVKDMGGYPGVSLLMALWYHGSFDTVRQWSNISKVPRATLFLIRKELVKEDLITRSKMELTPWGERVCKILDAAKIPVVSKNRLIEITVDCKHRVRH